MDGIFKIFIKTIITTKQHGFGNSIASSDQHLLGPYLFGISMAGLESILVVKHKLVQLDRLTI